MLSSETFLFILKSLEHSLSTFSGHILRLCGILELASPESLILIDEIGSGTDPSEGLALSTSILHYIVDRAKLAVVTTHYADLSFLKLKDHRFENAAMDFSLETLQPTYRVIWGSIGSSNALNIAKLVGLDQKVLDRAHEWVQKLMPDKQEERQGVLYESLLKEKHVLEDQAKKAIAVYSEIKKLYDEVYHYHNFYYHTNILIINEFISPLTGHVYARCVKVNRRSTFNLIKALSAQDLHINFYFFLVKKKIACVQHG